MEALMIRGFVLALALSGFGATTVSTGNGSTATSATANEGVVPPSCPYSDPNACGMD